MSGEGYWIRYGGKFKAVEIDDHEKDIRDWKVAKSLGVERAIFDQFKNFRVEDDREEFLTWLRGYRGRIFTFDNMWLI